MIRSRIIFAAALLAVVLLFSGSAFAQNPANITVISGNGQMICALTAFCPGQVPGFFGPMVARVTDANGFPLAGATVNWAVTAGNFSFGDFCGLTSSSTTTDSSGLTSNNFNICSTDFVTGTPALAFLQNTITASIANSAVNFFLTETLPERPELNGNVLIQPVVVRTAPGGREDLFPGTVFSGAVGTTVVPPVVMQVVTSRLSAPVPNVAVQFVNDQTANHGPTVLCATQGGAGTDTVLTDPTGIATCNPVMGGLPNVTGTAYLAIGGYNLNVFPPTYFQIPGGDARFIVRATPGLPGALRLISGNNQSAQAGTALAAPLVVELDSTGGVGLSGSTINWRVASGSATLTTASTVTGSNGQTSNTLRFPQTANGPAQIIASLSTDPTKSVTFTATAVPNITVTGLQILSGNNQSAIVNTAFGAPLVVQLNASNGSPAGLPVQFTATGPGLLSANTVTTDANGQARVNITAGGTPGAVSVLAQSSGFSQTFTLTVSPAGPSLTANSFYNAADFQRGFLSPCSLATVIAPGLAPGIQGMVSATPFGPLPYVLANDKVTVGGSAAPIMSVGTNNGQEQLTFQVPCEVNPGSSVPVVINVGAGSGTINLPIQAASPGVFRTVMSDNVTRAVVLRPDGSFVSLQNPARRGENLVAFLTGMGPANPPVGTNAVAAPGGVVAPQGTVVVGMAGGGVPLISSQLSYDVVGLWMVTFSVPVDVTTGDNIPFSVSVIPIGSSTPISSGTTTIPIR